MIKKILRTGQLKAWASYKKLSRYEHPLTYLFWECTLNCNFYCQHCGSNAGRKIIQNELTTEQIKNAFKQIAAQYDAKNIMISVTGGEPLLRDDLFEVMNFANQLGFPWGIVSNGSLINKKVVDNLKKAGASSVDISIDGIGKTHNKFRNYPGAYQKAIRAVKLLSENKFLKNLEIISSIHHGNIHQLEEMYKVFSKLGINSWRVMNIDPIGRAEKSDILLYKDEMKYLLDFIKQKRKSSKLLINYSCAGFLGLDYEKEVRGWFFNCATGINIASILHNGDIYVCPNVPRKKELIQGNIKKDDFTKVWESKFKLFRRENRTICKKCKGCQWWDECLGNSFHLWDFDKKEPKICHLEMLG